MVHIGEGIISSDLQLAFLADRVANSLSSRASFSERDKEVLKKAKLLLDDALHGSEVLETGQLQARAAEQLGAYNLTVHAYAALAQSHKMSQKDDIQEVIKTFQEDLSDFIAGAVANRDKINLLHEFFSYVRDICLRHDVIAFDEVSIGNRGSHGVIYYR